jgi:hypothetical protein
MRRPADVYKASTNAYPKRPRSLTYPAWFEVRRVRQAGQIVVNGTPRFIGHAFAGVDVGLEPISSAHWLVHAGPLVLGKLERNSKNSLLPLVTHSAYEH